MMKRQQLGLILRLLTAIVLLTLLILIIDRDALIATFLSVDIPLYTLGFVLFIGTILTWTLRWHLLMRAAGEVISYGKSLVTLTISMFFSMFLPTVVGTDLGRVYELGRDSSYRKSKLISSVLLDRLMGLMTISLMALIGLVVGSQFAGNQGVNLTVIGTLVVLFGGWVLVFNKRAEKIIFGILDQLPFVKRFSPQLHKVYTVLDELYRQPRLLAQAGSVSIVNSLCTILATLLAARSIGVEISPLYFFIFMPIIWIIMTIPISVSGLGVREGAFIFFFSQVGVTNSDAIAISLLYYSYNVIVGIIGGLLLLYTSVTQTRAQPQP
ncbi:MAG TPA: lysylphosphatidylglycerol synthase transmembrane domain-containing protein [Aggregatilineales bacterium]|nr:lysylphosphatidylglycerol synthase transmembrane domain-containing protein [Aggregatilineales bacterium]